MKSQLLCSRIGCMDTMHAILFLPFAAVTRRSVACSNAQEEGVTVIVSISPQSRASLAEATGMSAQAVLRRLTSFFSGLVSGYIADGPGEQQMVGLNFAMSRCDALWTDNNSEI